MNRESALFGLVFFLGVTLNSAAAQPPATAPFKLPYDRTCPVIYDNDYANDYVDWYLMALANAGEIRYKGISTSSSIAPYNQYMPAEALDDCVSLRTKIVSIGRASGLRNIPDPVARHEGTPHQADFGQDRRHPADRCENCDRGMVACPEELSECRRQIRFPIACRRANFPVYTSQQGLDPWESSGRIRPSLISIATAISTGMATSTWFQSPGFRAARTPSREGFTWTSWRICSTIRYDDSAHVCPPMASEC